MSKKATKRSPLTVRSLRKNSLTDVLSKGYNKLLWGTSKKKGNKGR